MRPFRFLADARSVVPGRALTETARRAEAMCFSMLVFPDHLIDQLAPIPAMATVAAATEHLRVGAFVLNNDLRHPAVLAQDLASLDVLSEGRLEVAIGAGWNQPEHDAIGLPFDPVPTRVARLKEAVAVLKGCFADGPFSFRGEFYTITDLDGRRKPARRPPGQLWSLRRLHFYSGFRAPPFLRTARQDSENRRPRRGRGVP